MIQTLAVRGYRSLREVLLGLGQLTVITGANGTGKTNLYRALALLAAAASGEMLRALAHTGGFQSVLWAGPEKLSADMKSGYHPVQLTVRQKPVSLGLGFGTEELSYQIDLGPPARREPTAFVHDPEIKREVIWAGPVLRPAATLIDRRRGQVRCLADSGWKDLPWTLGPGSSVLDELVDPQAFPEAAALRREVRQWRFYDGFRTDQDAPARHPQAATFTPALSSDGHDLAAAVQSIAESSAASEFAALIDDAFPDTTVATEELAGRLLVSARQRGMLRPLLAPELSDGTLRYLMLAAALYAVRPPTLMVLNEPETSLHPDLLPPLARLIRSAAR
ncbi:MAG: AAA family ATPase, partial [Propionibacteriaceae bacterium]|nr:AAA family ATPase [Propionibacteriaceae bacterium]